MYTIKVLEDNTLLTTVWEKLIKSDQTINSIHILVPKTYTTAYYGDVDMTDYDMTMIYVQPDASAVDYHVIKLTKKSTDYKDNYIEYVIPPDDELLSKKQYISSLAGYVKFKLILTKTGETAVDSDGNSITYVYLRETFPGVFYITTNSIEDTIKSVENNTNSNSASNFATIGGLTTVDGKIYIVDNNGSTIGNGVTISDAYISNTYAQGLKVVKI